MIFMRVCIREFKSSMKTYLKSMELQTFEQPWLQLMYCASYLLLGYKFRRREQSFGK